MGQDDQLKHVKSSCFVQMDDLLPLDSRTLSFNCSYAGSTESSRKHIMKGRNFKKLARSNVRVSILMDSEISSVMEEQNFVDHIIDGTRRDNLASSSSVDIVEEAGVIMPLPQL